MGGQACVLYGGAEFSRDADLCLLAERQNLIRLQQALDDLQAECIAVPPFDKKYLDMGLAIHFRCHQPEARNLRIDMLSKMRGVDDFHALWPRRTTLIVAGEPIELMALPDLVQAKKTQRDKDWPMITRLLEANYFQNRDQPTPEQVHFWLLEMRTPSLLFEVARRFAAACNDLLPRRGLLATAQTGDEAALQAALREEEEHEREADRLYWLPLRQELERLRRAARP